MDMDSERMNYANNGENSTYKRSRNEEVQGLYINTAVHTLHTVYVPLQNVKIVVTWLQYFVSNVSIVIANLAR